MTPSTLEQVDSVDWRNASQVPRRKVRVTYFLGSLRLGGTERQVQELIRHLDRDIFEPSLILMEDVDPSAPKALVDRHEVLGVPESGNSQWLSRSRLLAMAAHRARRGLKSLQSEIVHAFLPAPCVLAGLTARLAKIPLIIGSRRSLPSQYRARSKVAAWADTVAFRLAHFNLGNSGAVSREMVELARCPADKCGTIYNGVDVNRFRPDIPPSLRQKLNWTGDEVVFGMVANFRPCKRHQDFVELASIVARRNSRARFLLAGADGGAKKTIVEQIKDRDLESKIQVLEAGVAPEMIFAAIDVYVCTSEAEGFSNSILEAMACGKPVIATRVGGNPEAVQHGMTGLLVPPHDVVSSSQATIALLDNPCLRKEMGLTGRKRAEDEFPVHKMIRAHQDLYMRLFEKHTRAKA